MNYVIDCSFSSALFLPDENSDAAREFFLNLKKSDQIHIPLLWWYETNNVLNTAIKRKRLPHTEVINILNLLNQLKLDIDFESGIEFSKQILQLTQLYSLTSYDAVYMELAVRMKAKLMTSDNELILAAKKIGISVN